MWCPIIHECGQPNIKVTSMKVTIFNSKNQPEYIEDIPITTSITYLGVNIHNKKDCYKLQRQQKEPKKYSSMMPAIVAKSCNIILIGKTYLKSAALPAILHGTEAIYLSNTYLSNL